MDIAVVQGSLTDGKQTLLVNASNTNVVLGSGVSGAIRAACGAGYQESISKELTKKYGGPMTPGQVLITDAGKHPRARYVAHVSVMDYREGFTGSSFPTLDVIRACCTNLIRAIDELPEPVSVAMVALGAGTGKLGVRDPTKIACDVIRAYEGKKILDCTFYGFHSFEYVAMVEVVKSVFPGVVAVPSGDTTVFPEEPKPG